MSTHEKIYINGRFLTQPITGVQRFARETVRALDQLLAENLVSPQITFEIVVPRKVENPYRNIALTVYPTLAGHPWEQFVLPLICRDGILINLCNTAPLMQSRQAVVVHDASVLTAPEAYSPAFRHSYATLFQLLRRTDTVVMTVSEFSRRELELHAEFSIPHAGVLLEGAEHIQATPPDTDALHRWGLRKSGFVLAVGSRQANKNFAVLAKAIEMLPANRFDVVVAGSENGQVFEGGKPLPDWVKRVGFVSDATLRALYEAAGCFVFPSLYEGFGLPALEAMKCGCPVIASSAAAIPEVCGPAALYFEPNNVHDLSDQIARMMESAALRYDFAQRGILRADRFHWRDTATRLLNALAPLAGHVLTVGEMGAGESAGLNRERVP